MEFLVTAFEMFMHVDQHLLDLATAYGGWIYGIFF